MRGAPRELGCVAPWHRQQALSASVTWKVNALAAS